MTEAEARAWIESSFGVPHETMTALDRFVAHLIDHGTQQNLVAPSTFEHVWARHIVDSAQLYRLAPVGGVWLDIGSGAGFPGLILALLGASITLVEPRRRRVEFLASGAEVLGVTARIEIVQSKVQSLQGRSFDVICARAFAPLDTLLAASLPLSHPGTSWVLPKGRSAQAELDAARGSWQGDFGIVPSITDPDAAIIVATDVRPRTKSRR